MILDAVRQSQGCAEAVADGNIDAWQETATRTTGLSICPEGAACLGAAIALRERGWIGPADRVVLFNTAGAAKYDLPSDFTVPRIDPAKPLGPQLRGL